MIRINLLQERKKAARVDRGNRSLATGAGVVILAAAAVFFLVHMPLTSAISDLRAENARRQKNIQKLTEETKEFDTVQAQLNAAQAQEEAIKRLNSARATPAWMLYEISNILTRDHKPTMTPEMAERVKSDPSRQFSPGWDPKRVWVNTIEEKNGQITIAGGAQSIVDVTQFALRMQASVFFMDVQTPSVSQTTDGRSKQLMYKFTLTGKALY